MSSSAPSGGFYRLTPSSLSFLRESCPLCFWRKCRGMSVPSGAFPRVFRVLDGLMQDMAMAEMEFLSGLSSLLKTDVWTKLPMLTSKPIPSRNGLATFVIRGMPDCVVYEGKAKAVVLDFKTTMATPSSWARYHSSLMAYRELIRSQETARIPVVDCKRGGLAMWSPSEIRRSDAGHAVVSGAWTMQVQRLAESDWQDLLDQVAVEVTGEEPKAGKVCPYHAGAY